jgi:hypothetical protein
MADQRFASSTTDERPEFRKHVVPLLGRMGCNGPALAVGTKLDEFIQAKLLKLGILPSTLCTDGVFLRRVSLDLTGTLPYPEEIHSFLSDQSSDKRARKIEDFFADQPM